MHWVAAAMVQFHPPETTNTLHLPRRTLCIHSHLQSRPTRFDKGSLTPKPSYCLPPQTSLLLTATSSHLEDQRLSIPFLACNLLLLKVSISNAVHFSNTPCLRSPPNIIPPTAQSRSPIQVSHHRTQPPTQLSA